MIPAYGREECWRMWLAEGGKEGRKWRSKRKKKEKTDTLKA
jgi:hypothetical protein